ncbi:MAG: type II toxin-antitoxin system HicA family toxin [Pedobacter sp.]|nr:MAG: type II toxin-antitoxin system HicA family toxin [Pedobacter sp.]
MSRNGKLLSRLLSVPKDFSWDELVSLLAYYGIKKIRSGKTGVSRRKFVDPNNNIISLHEPHPSKIMKGICHPRRD